MRISGLLALSALAVFPAKAEVDELARMQPGQWLTVMESHIEGEVYGQPILESDTDTTDECIDAQNAALLEQAMSDETCEMEALEQDSRFLRAAVTCTTEGLSISGEALMRLSPDYDMVVGDIQMSLVEDMVEIRMLGRIWAHRTSACSS
tara:strand:- start:3739 stop:4188 length:450 start_codon:yes stop_codon:yes gene_type:complete